MNCINIDPKFQPFGAGLEINKFNFPSGCEPHIKLSNTEDWDFTITVRPNSTDDIFQMMLANDALKRMGVINRHLFISYLPFARQDRVMVKGEPLSLKVIADLINLQDFRSVKIYDPHSEVSLAVINNSEAISNHQFVKSCLQAESNYLIVSPDAGAYKKIFKLCQFLSYTDKIVLCNKTRDASNGNIISTTCDTEDFQGRNLVIVDDICDGGGTFVLLAQELRKRNSGQIILIVSHGIFSKGVAALEGIDHVYTTDSFKDITHPKLTQLNLNYGLLSE